jgi:hypothetical protein
MDILWPALGIAVIVIFMFFVLARHWQQLLRQQSRAIRQLAQRVQNLEDMADPELRRRLGDAAPVPLEQVFTFSMRLGERFWREAMRASEEDRKFVQEYGSFLASVKLERWRSHTVATVSEILPARKSAGLHTRTLDYYSNSANRDEALLLWELALARPSAAGLRPPSLELLLRGDALELRASQISAVPEASSNGRSGSENTSETAVLLHLPLDPTQLDEFRQNEPESAAEQERSENKDRGGAANAVRMNSASYWHAFYAGSDEALGIEWELRLRDLGKKAEWERWRIWESRTVPVGND